MRQTGGGGPAAGFATATALPSARWRRHPLPRAPPHRTAGWRGCASARHSAPSASPTKRLRDQSGGGTPTGRAPPTPGAWRRGVGSAPRGAGRWQRHMAPRSTPYCSVVRALPRRTSRPRARPAATAVARQLASTRRHSCQWVRRPNRGAPADGAGWTGERRHTCGCGRAACRSPSPAGHGPRTLQRHKPCILHRTLNRVRVRGLAEWDPLPFALPPMNRNPNGGGYCSAEWCQPLLHCPLLTGHVSMAYFRRKQPWTNEGVLNVDYVRLASNVSHTRANSGQKLRRWAGIEYLRC